MRKLVFVPMIHSPKEVFEAKKEWRIRQIELPEGFSGISGRYWEIVKEATSNLNLKDTRIYWESYCGDTFTETKFEIDQKLKGSPEAAVLNQLLANGAILERTETMLLLNQAVKKLKKLDEMLIQLQQELKQGDLDGSPTKKDLEIVQRIIDLHAELDNLNNERDEFVARRIDKTLQEGETGILFMGGGHDIASKLPAGIQVTLLDERLNEFREFFQENERTLDACTKGLERKG